MRALLAKKKGDKDDAVYHFMFLSTNRNNSFGVEVARIVCGV